MTSILHQLRAASYSGHCLSFPKVAPHASTMPNLSPQGVGVAGTSVHMPSMVTVVGEEGTIADKSMFSVALS